MASSVTPVATSAVIYAKNKDTVAEFYRSTLSLTVEEADAGFTLLTGPGIELSVVQIPEQIARTFSVASPPEVRESTPLKCSFLVSSFEAVRQAAARTGGSLKPLEAAWSWRGALHLDGNDPEGNVVQFRRSHA